MSCIVDLRDIEQMVPPCNSEAHTTIHVLYDATGRGSEIGRRVRVSEILLLDFGSQYPFLS